VFNILAAIFLLGRGSYHRTINLKL